MGARARVCAHRRSAGELGLGRAVGLRRAADPRALRGDGDRAARGAHLLGRVLEAQLVPELQRRRAGVHEVDRVVLRAHDEPVGALDDVGDAVVRRRAADRLGSPGGEVPRARDAAHLVGAWGRGEGHGARGGYGSPPEAGARAPYVQGVAAWGRAALRLRYVQYAECWHAWPARTVGRPHGVRVSLGGRRRWW